MDERFELMLEDKRHYVENRVKVWFSYDGDQDSSYIEHEGICVDCGQRPEILCDNYEHLTHERLSVIDVDHYWECSACKTIRGWARMAAKAARRADWIMPRENWIIMQEKYAEHF
jgi:hypothetical protein